MQQFQNYYPPMNNYGQPYNLQQTYMERMASAQNYQPNMQMQQPQPTAQQNMAGINGKVVPGVENITANDVPMDGSVAFFPRQDMQEIYAKSWNADGTIRTIVYKPISEPNLPDGANIPQNDFDRLNEDVRTLREEIANRFDNLEKFLANSASKTTKSSTRAKKEVNADE